MVEFTGRFHSRIVAIQLPLAPTSGGEQLSLAKSLMSENDRFLDTSIVIFRRRLHQLTGRNARCAVGS